MRTPTRSRKTWTNALLACLVLANLSLAKAATPDDTTLAYAAHHAQFVELRITYAPR